MAFALNLMADMLAGGVFPATRLATPQGWQAAAGLRPGQLVLTVDGGWCALQAIEVLAPPLWLMSLPKGVCGNRDPVRLTPGQSVKITTAPALAGGWALLPSQALEGWRGVMAQPNAEPPLRLRLARPALVLAESGLILGFPGEDRDVSILPLEKARAEIARLMAKDLGRDLAQAALRGE